MDSIHELRLDKVIVLIELKALMEECGVDLIGETHETDSLVLHLSNQSFIVLVLRCDQLSQEILAISFSYSFRLVVKNISEVIVIFLISVSHLDERQHEHSRGEEHPGGWSDTSDVREYLGVFELNFFKVDAERVKAVVDIFVVCVTSYLI